MKQFWKVLCSAALTALILGSSGSLHVFVAQAQDGTLPPSRQQDTNDAGLLAFGTAKTPAELIDKAQTLGNIRIIVGLKTNTRFQPDSELSSVQAQSQQNEIVQVRQSLLQTVVQNGTTILAQSDQWTIPYVALQVDAAGLQALQASPQVTSIREDSINFPVNNSASLNNMAVPAAWANGYDGTGYTVAVLDTGVQRNHNFLGGRVVAEHCRSTYGDNYPFFIIKSLCPGSITTQTATGVGAADPAICMSRVSVALPNEKCDHGTHVAGIAAGNDGNNGSVNDGVARGANIIGVQIFSFLDCLAGPPYCSSRIGAYDTDIIAGLQYVYSLRSKYKISSVNMSLGSGKYSSQSACDSDDTAIKAIIDQLRAANIATIIASGNNRYGAGISSPACISSAIAVGSTSDGGEYPAYLSNSISSFTNANFMLDLLAPGYGIYSSITLPTNTGFAYKDGTSMASPQVAGAWAVMRDAFPNASVTQILQAFQQTGTPVFDNVRANGSTCSDGGCSYFTYPLINVDAAIISLLPNVPSLIAPVQDASTFSKPLLTWAGDTGNTYEVRLDVVNPPVTQATAASASYTPTTALKGKLYYWQVRARNSLGGFSDWSEIRSFYNIDAPTDRNYFNTNTATFSWSRITWATGYEVQIGTNANFTGAPPAVPLSESTFTHTTDALSDGLYYWRVRAMNGASGGTWSPAEPFVIDFVP